jgi:hypothetical protein
MGDAAFMLQVKVWPLRVRAAGGTMFQCSTLCQTKGASPPHVSFSSFHSLALSKTCRHAPRIASDGAAGMHTGRGQQRASAGATAGGTHWAPGSPPQ